MNRGASEHRERAEQHQNHDEFRHTLMVGLHHERTAGRPRRWRWHWPTSADALTIGRFGAVDLHVDTKPDLTPVTDADRSVEAGSAGGTVAPRPDDAVLGEEYGGTTDIRRPAVDDRPDRRHQELRPRACRCGRRLIALLDDGVPVVGVVSAPALQRRWWAAAGQAHSRGRRRAAAAARRCRRSASWNRPACRSPACPGGRTGVRDALCRAD